MVSQTTTITITTTMTMTRQQNNLDPKLFGTLPMDLIREVIMPYAYKPQSQELLCDIRSFYADWKLLQNYYIDYNMDINNYTSLHEDLQQFCYDKIGEMMDTNCYLFECVDYMNLDDISYKEFLVKYIRPQKKNSNKSRNSSFAPRTRAPSFL